MKKPINIKNNKKLIWLDLEMTGLDPNIYSILEIGFLITDYKLNIIYSGTNIVLNQNEEKLSLMDEWNINTHTRNGLLDKVKESKVSESEAENKVIKIISDICEYKDSPICGNNISHDRKFLKKYMPNLEDYFNYKHLDVNSIKEFIKICKPNSTIRYKKKNYHRALFDIKESLNELIFYKKKVFEL